MNQINVLMSTGEITKTGTLTTTLQKHAVDGNMYVWFGYGSQKICNQTRGQVQYQ